MAVSPHSEMLAVSCQCHSVLPHSLEQSGASAWFQRPGNPRTDAQAALQDPFFLEARYAEALWLGEFHTSLTIFLRWASTLVQSRRENVAELLVALSKLLKSRSQIKQRHSSAILDTIRRVTESQQHVSQPIAAPASLVSGYELDLLRQVSRYGAISKVLQSSGGPLATQWAQAMESREYQLQVLVTMCLLQIVSQHPRAAEEARLQLQEQSGNKATSIDGDDMAGECSEHAGTSTLTKKRRRKLEKPKRWQESLSNADENDDFAWNRPRRKRNLTANSLEDGTLLEQDSLEAEGPDVLDAEHLNKRVEALTDTLCLSQATAGVLLELADLLESRGERGETSATADASGSSVPLFGSAARKYVQKDEMDDAQWLCCGVVEPHFGAQLPRQCSSFRSKCFVTLQSSTPARATGRTSAAASRPLKTRKRTKQKALFGLSDVLEKEQAGKKLKKSLAVESSSVLARGREVDMTRRLSRSVSAGPRLVVADTLPSTAGSVEGQKTAGGIGSWRESTRSLSTHARNGSQQRVHSMLASRKRKENAAGVGSIRLGESSQYDDAARQASDTGSARLLVLSTPQKARSESQTALTSLVRETSRFMLPESFGQPSFASSLGASNALGQVGSNLNSRARLAGLDLDGRDSQYGNTDRRLRRSASPVVFESDIED
ncbi:hypothetical protein BCV70DRAFT_103986 [Testicularia cyperi]|uniref:DNA replication regulator Sld3 C-terminal domain-containing protein n=1 Tax=Testicularia cyperi TaxID=1882483 RepID=A0A317XQ44_9BASI|nr:hypothetical protein BCV70DRAFT_103986 [Testicularia cyperi]